MVKVGDYGQILCCLENLRIRLNGCPDGAVGRDLLRPRGRARSPVREGLPALRSGDPLRGAVIPIIIQ